MREAVIVSAVRTPVGKAPKGALKDTRPEDYAALVVNEAVKRVPGLDPKEIDDLILGCAFPEGEQGMNLGRVVAMRAQLPIDVSGMTINRFCSSGLQSIAIAAERIMCGFADVIVAGGVESMSMVPMGGYKIAPNPWLMDNWPDAYLGMGLTAENVARKYQISRDAMDTFAVESHRKAADAIQTGRFKDETVPVPVIRQALTGNKITTAETLFDTDEGVRPDTTLEGLAKLKPAFHAKGSVTAGNSSQMSDGAAALVIMAKEKADAMGLKPLAYYRSFAVGGVGPEVMGIGPVVAIPKALKLAGITKDQIDLMELNEAFAAQALAVIQELDLDRTKINVNGGAIALGHPLGCTGAKLTTSLLYEMARRNVRYGVVSMCIGGGMGAAGVFERI